MEYDPYYETYVSLVPETDIVRVLAEQPVELAALVGDLPEERGSFAYGEGKWSIKEVLGHLVDGERMFMYRMFRISRGDETPIEGFEQDGYIEHGRAGLRTISDILNEFDLLRRSNTIFCRNLDQAGWQRIGTANNAAISVRALAYIMAGHIRHHISILKERYMV